MLMHFAMNTSTTPKAASEPAATSNHVGKKSAAFELDSAVANSAMIAITGWQATNPTGRVALAGQPNVAIPPRDTAGFCKAFKLKTHFRLSVGLEMVESVTVREGFADTGDFAIRGRVD